MSRRECESLRPLLSALLDEELDDAERVRLDGHLASCVACQQLLSEYTALQDRVRYLAPTPPPPPDIWQAVQAEARKDAQRSWFSRWIRVSAAQFTMSSAAVMVLLVLISGFALFQGYQRSVNPAIAASFPDAYQRWPVGQPIKITFNKPMNHDSVVENIQIWPAPEEKQRLPMDWHGETLVIQTDPSRGAPLVPDTRYTIMVLPGATDTWGNRLGRAWKLSFEMTHSTGPALAEAESSSPNTSQAPASAQASSPSGEKKTTKGAAGSPSPSASASPSPSPSALALAGPKTTAQQATASPNPPASSDASGNGPSPSPSSTPSPSESPSPAAASPAAPSTASLASPADAASPTPIPLGSPQTIPVTGAFGSVYWGNQSVQDRLGPPRAVESTIDAAELSFQRGSMYEWLSNKTVYVFFSNGIWMPVQVTTPGASGTGQPVEGSSNAWIPPAGFNEAWNATPSIQTDIGYAVSAQARTMEGRMQPFANGTMLYSDRGFVYVIFYDGYWELYPDTSGHGDLITPTPEPDPSPAPATGPSASPAPGPASESSPPPGGDVSGSSPAPSASSSPQPTANMLPDDVILQGK